MHMEGLARILITFGIILLLAGFVVLALSRLGLTGFRLPGDILIRRENFTFFFPITTMLLVSLLLTLVLNLLARR